MPSPRLALASNADREAIYRLRHDVYASELGQHSIHDEGFLRDALDGFNEYVVATAGSDVLGRHALRVAVKDEAGNRRIVETLAWALGR